MSAAGWDRYRKCPVCAAETGEPCRDLSGYLVGVQDGAVDIDKPHSRRELRMGVKAGEGDG